MSDLFDLSGRVAVVAGGAGLIGAELSRALAGHGANVVVADADADAAGDLVNDIGGRAQFESVDVTDPAGVEALFESVVDEHARLDVLVNGAYPRNESYGRPYEAVTIGDFRKNIAANLDACFLTARHAASRMVESGGGSIVNLGSIYGVQAPDFRVYEGTDMTSPVEYAAVKGGVLNLMRYLASYLGPRGIRVNAVSPGGVYDGQDEAFVERYERRTPLGRMAEPGDVAGAVVYLASDASSYVTGHNLVVDGGWTIK